MTTTTIAELGALIGDPGRANMLIALLDGRALTARELADHAGVTPQTASGHLARLLAAQMIRVERQGRHRYHRLASSDIADLLEAMHVAGARLVPRAGARRTGPVDPAMRAARSCYDHIAGALGVTLADVLAIPDHAASAALTINGEQQLTAWGIDLAGLRAKSRPFCRTCIDWSERRPHLAGAVGAAILERSLSLGWLRRRQGSRALSVTHAGQMGFYKALGASCIMSGPTPCQG